MPPLTALHVSRTSNISLDDRAPLTADRVLLTGHHGVKLIQCPNVMQEIRTWETQWQTTPDPNPTVVCVWHHLPGIASLLNDTLDRLAQVALSLWPNWSEGIDANASSVSGERRTVHANWRAAARQLCQRNRLPRVEGFLAETEAAQLALAMPMTDLAIVLALTDEVPSDRLYGLARVAELLANSTQACISVLISDKIPWNIAELDSINFSGVTLPPLPTLEPTNDLRLRPSPTEEKQQLITCPCRGVPHPNSMGEQRLADALRRDSELRGLFLCNEPLETICGTRYLVDLVCKAYRLIIEVDGYHWHSDEQSFGRDRTRDYEFLISGYVTLRLPHSAILRDLPEVMTRIRRVVSFRRENQEYS